MELQCLFSSFHALFFHLGIFKLTLRMQFLECLIYSSLFALWSGSRQLFNFSDVITITSI